MPSIGQHEYPATSVADAIETTKKIATQFKGQPFDRSALAATLGNKSATTGAFNQLLADLRRYGVVDGRGNTLQVTPLAQRLTVPTNGEEFSQAVFEMMARIPLFKLLYEHTEGRAPSEDELLATLINITKADRTAVQSVVARIRNNFASGLSRMGSLRPRATDTIQVEGRPAVKSVGGTTAVVEPQEAPASVNIIEVRAGDVRLKYPLTSTGLKLMRLNFEGAGFWKIMEEEVSRIEKGQAKGDGGDASGK